MSSIRSFVTNLPCFYRVCSGRSDRKLLNLGGISSPRDLRQPVKKIKVVERAFTICHHLINTLDLNNNIPPLINLNHNKFPPLIIIHLDDHLVFPQNIKMHQHENCFVKQDRKPLNQHQDLLTKEVKWHLRNPSDLLTASQNRRGVRTSGVSAYGKG